MIRERSGLRTTVVISLKDVSALPPAKSRRGRRVAGALLLLSFIFFSNTVWCSDIQRSGRGVAWESIDIPVRSLTAGTHWCGAGGQLVVVHLEKRNAWIELIDPSGQTIKTIKIDGPYLTHGCSPDGRYLFLSSPSKGLIDNLQALDIESGKLRTLYHVKAELPMINLTDPISPDGTYAIGPPEGLRPIALAEEREIRFVPIPVLSPKTLFTEQKWAPDGKTLFLSGYRFKDSAPTVVVCDVEAGRYRVINPSLKRDSYIRQIRAGSDGRWLYLSVNRDEHAPDKTDLFIMDTRSGRTTLALLAKNIQEFDLFPDGSIVFSQGWGPGRSKAIFVADGKGKNRKLIARFTDFSFVLSPFASHNGNRIALFRRTTEGTKTLTVLTRSDR